MTDLTGVRELLLGQSVDTAVESRRRQQVMPAPARRAGDRIADVLGRAVIVVLFTMLAMRLGADYLATGRFTGLLLLAGEAMVVVLTVVRRRASWMDRSWRARLLTVTSITGPFLLRPAAHAALSPEAITVTMSVAGLSIVLLGKLSLGRSFGLMPANRGVVCSGVYRFVRHPIYAGYLVTHLAFALAHATLWNITLLLTADLALLVRSIQEERTLALDPFYVGYQQRVRWRILPGVF